MLRWSRTVALAIALVGALTNFALAVQLFALWRTFKSDTESEWEGSIDSFTVNGFKLVGMLSAAYFVTAAAASTAGLLGIFKGIPAYVRFYRDYSIADFSFTTLTTLLVTYASFRYSSVRTGVCEEVSRHPDFMREMQQLGLNLENCEQWFERAIVAFVILMLIVIVVRLHFVLAISHYYSQLSRHHGCCLPAYYRINSGHQDTNGLQRIYLLPSPTSPSSSSSQSDIVYAPVPLRDLSEQDARELNAREAWITTSPTTQSPRSHRHGHSHSHSHRHHATGRIGLPIRPNEGLLPGHEKRLKD